MACHSHAYLISKAGSAISRKSPQPAPRRSATHHTEPHPTEKQGKTAHIIGGDFPQLWMRLCNLLGEIRLRAANAAPPEGRQRWPTTNHRTVFTDETHMRIWESQVIFFLPISSQFWFYIEIYTWINKLSIDAFKDVPLKSLATASTQENKVCA